MKETISEILEDMVKQLTQKHNILQMTLTDKEFINIFTEYLRESPYVYLDKEVLIRLGTALLNAYKELMINGIPNQYGTLKYN